MPGEFFITLPVVLSVPARKWASIPEPGEPFWRVTIPVVDRVRRSQMTDRRQRNEGFFEAYSDVQSIRPKKRSSCRDEPAGARYAIGASETGRSLLEANRPLAGCFPAEPASVSSGNVISTQDSRERNHGTSEYASKNPSLRWSQSAIWLRRTRSPTGIVTFQNGSPGSGILAHFLAGTDMTPNLPALCRQQQTRRFQCRQMTCPVRLAVGRSRSPR